MTFLIVAVAAMLTLATPHVSFAQDAPQWFGGGILGVSTLSADAQHDVSADTVAVSLYKPENGPAANLFVGAHLTDYVTLQANYIWNQNALTLLSTATAGGVTSVVEQPRDSSQHSLVGDVLLYFRQRESATRVYLSFGGGLLAVTSTSSGETLAIGAAPLSPAFTAYKPVLRVAVGIDVRAGLNWSVRYSFSESLSRNPISQRLSPPAPRRLANFQNLVGVIRSF